jgi:hypothetical protein
MFNSFAPSIQDYLPLYEDLIHYDDNNAMLYNFYVID